MSKHGATGAPRSTLADKAIGKELAVLWLLFLIIIVFF